MKRQRLDVPGRDLQVGGLAGAKCARGDDHERFRLHDGDPLASLGSPGLDGDLLEPLDRLGRVSLFGLVEARRSRTGHGRPARWPGNLLVSGSQAAIAWSNFFSVTKLSPIWNKSSGTRPSSGFWATKSFQAARASGKWRRFNWSAAIKSWVSRMAR